ncbi:Plant organelle RNA recognition domain containing protein [Trema orientale]|uniref:Plant organelle RNA recognition domain containing protein n=1 Tax=Trema orientale TaxID=63057 RepID=A0A2P5EEH2_TREOI|nr:Plant organelle RNA recognition domain containing protein [Trema orientale]
MAAWTKLPHRFNPTRTFVDARVKWVRDPYLDFAVEREKNLKQAISFKHQILSDPSRSLPLSLASLLKPRLDLSTTASNFFRKYPSFFSLFQPSPGLPPRVKLTRQALSLHREESAIHTSQPHRDDAVGRLARLLMLTGSARLPIYVIERLKWDLGLPHNFMAALVIDFPDYFQVCEVEDPSTGRKELALEIVSWRKELAVSELERRALNDDGPSGNRTKRIAFPMVFPKGYELVKKVKDWVEEWQRLPYISPYENGFHLSQNSDQAEKWTVAVLHELLWLMVSKKTERDNLFCLGEYLGFGSTFKKALVHHPGIFYLSNKIRTQTVLLREAYRKDFLLEKHPLMGMRYRYIHLLNKTPKMRRPALGLPPGNKQHETAFANGVGRNLSFEGTHA